jgi:hypothetical protein
VRRCVLACLGLLLAALGSHRPQLVVNGVEVPGATNDLVPGTAYAPAAGLAEALGARLDVDLATQRLTLTLGGRIVQLRTSTTRRRAALPAVTVATASPPRGPAACWWVRAVRAGQGHRRGARRPRELPRRERNQVLVVVPRPSRHRPAGGQRQRERLVLRVSGPTRVTSFVNETVQTVQLRFERSDVASPASFVGDAFVRADVARTAGRRRPDPARPDVRASWTELPDGRASPSWSASLGPAADAPMPVRRASADAHRARSRHAAPVRRPRRRPRRSRSPASSAQRLERAGYEVSSRGPGRVCRPPATGPLRAPGARLFLTLQVADLPRGSLRLYHLGDAAELSALEDAVRINAEAVLERPDTDGVRRQVLLDLVVDLDLGARYAEALAAELRQTPAASRSRPARGTGRGADGRGGPRGALEVGAADLRDPASRRSWPPPWRRSSPAAACFRERGPAPAALERRAVAAARAGGRAGVRGRGALVVGWLPDGPRGRVPDRS